MSQKAKELDVFEFMDPAAYLEARLKKAAASERGVKSKLAAVIQCHPAYLTRILKGKSTLSLEQGDRLNQYFAHTDEESRFFLLLIQFTRAGTESLRVLFKKDIDAGQSAHINRKKGFKSKSAFSDKFQATFYSSWQYSAILTGLAVPLLASKEKLSQRFKIPLKRVGEIIEFLKENGLVQLDKGAFKVNSSPHIADDAATIMRDHANWRLMAIRSFENRGLNDVHYSSVVSISEADTFKVKSMILNILQEARTLIHSSKEEKVCSLLVDFFEV